MLLIYAYLSWEGAEGGSPLLHQPRVPAFILHGAWVFAPCVFSPSQVTGVDIAPWEAEQTLIPAPSLSDLRWPTSWSTPAPPLLLFM